jgi:hypothetical protein
MAMIRRRTKLIEMIARWHISKIITAFTSRTEKNHEHPQTR